MGNKVSALKKLVKPLFWILVVAVALTAQVALFMGVWERKYQPKIAVTQMFEQDGCVSYKFNDNGTDQYFVKCKCGAEIKFSNGKVGVVACQQVVDPAQDLRVKEAPKFVMPAPAEPEKKK